MHVEKAFKTVVSGRWFHLPTGMGGKPAIGLKSICPFCSGTYWVRYIPVQKEITPS